MKFRVHHALLLCLLSTAARTHSVAAQVAREGTVPVVAVRPGDELLGLWGAEQVLGPQVRGELVLSRRGAIWSLRAGGAEVSVAQQGDSVVLALGDSLGTLRVWLRPKADPDAFWVQPPGMNAPFATPVRLRRERRDRWRGRIAPVPEEFSLYLMVQRAADSTLRGTFRNPEMNWSGRTAYIVGRSGDEVTFTDPITGRVPFRQPYRATPRSIAFDFGAPIVLTPRTREQAAGFVTRAPSLPPYRYRTPARMGDAWRTASAATVRMDAAALQAIVRSLIDVDPTSETEPRVHSLLVARDGRLVLDEYFRGHDASTLHDLRSASKTMTSIMAGAAMQRGATIDAAPLGAGSKVSSEIGSSGMTLGHLLSHSTGLACNDDDPASPGNEDTMQSQRAQPDWYAFFMALPRLAAPGSTYSYCSAGMHMAGGVIARATGQWLPRLFDSALARPMAFGDYGINLAPSGDAYAGGGMRLRPRDLLKFGQLYLDGGRWGGQQLVPEAWVSTSTARVIDRADGSSDGYGWHRYEVTAGGRRYQTYEASGNGGQFLVVVPALRLAMVVTAGSYGQFAVWRKIREQLVPAVMEAAVQRDASRTTSSGPSPLARIGAVVP